jgi:hypothetical protein
MQRKLSTAAERLWNPFSWRLRELAALGRHPAGLERRQQLTEELVVAEATEVAQGVRHVSIVHGAPDSPRQAAQIDTFMAEVDVLIAPAGWSRWRGDHDHVIVAVGGDDAEERFGYVMAVAELSNPGQWRITPSARPVLDP